jgi:hypothetical protein
VEISALYLLHTANRLRGDWTQASTSNVIYGKTCQAANIQANTRTQRKSMPEECTIFWDITPCGPLIVNRRFGGTHRLHLQFSKKPACHLLAWWILAELIFLTLKMETRCSPETSVDTQRTTQRYIPEDGTLHNHRCENLKSYKEHVWRNRGRIVFIMAHIFLRDIEKLWSADTFVLWYMAPTSGVYASFFIFDNNKK